MFIATIQVINPRHTRFAFGCHTRKDQADRSAQISCHNRCAFEFRHTLDGGGSTLNVDFCAHTG